MLTLKGNTNYSLTLNQNEETDGTVNLTLSFKPVCSGVNNEATVSLDTGFKNVESVQQILNQTPQTPPTLISQSLPEQDVKQEAQQLLNPNNVPLPQQQFVQGLPNIGVPQQNPGLAPLPQLNPAIGHPMPQPQMPMQQQQPVQYPTQPWQQPSPTQTVGEVNTIIGGVTTLPNTQPWQQPVQPVAPVQTLDVPDLTQTNETSTEAPKKTRKTKTEKTSVATEPVVNTEDIIIGNYKIVKQSDGTAVYTNQTTNQISMLQYPKNNNFITVEVYQDGVEKLTTLLQKYGAEANQQKGCYVVTVTEDVFVAEIMSSLAA